MTRRDYCVECKQGVADKDPSCGYCPKSICAECHKDAGWSKGTFVMNTCGECKACESGDWYNCPEPVYEDLCRYCIQETQFMELKEKLRQLVTRYTNTDPHVDDHIDPHVDDHVYFGALIDELEDLVKKMN